MGFFRTTRNVSPMSRRVSGDTRRIARQALSARWLRMAPPMTDNLRDRVRGEYREMPRLRLTVAQAARLFNLDHAQCGQLLDTLVTDGAICTNGREYFGTNTGRRCAYRRSARELIDEHQYGDVRQR